MTEFVLYTSSTLQLPHNAEVVFSFSQEDINKVINSPIPCTSKKLVLQSVKKSETIIIVAAIA